MRVVIVDFGVGNIGSVLRASRGLGVEATASDDPESLDNSDRIILPGVGSFAEGMARLLERGWTEPIRRAVLERGVPILGICLGMQLFASRSLEGGETGGLDLLRGSVERLDSIGCTLRVPHVGWNSVEVRGSPRFLAGVPDGTDFYFVHSYAIHPETAEDVAATTTYGVPFVAAVEKGHIFGTQFHPEKSSRAGLRVLENFFGSRLAKD